MIKHVQIDKMLVLSTAHIKKETGDALDADGGMCWLTSLSWQCYGWILWVEDQPMPEEVGYPDLAAIFALARERGCSWVRLDCDGLKADALEVFEW